MAISVSLLSSWCFGKQGFFFLYPYYSILAQGLPGLSCFWKSQRRWSYTKNSLRVRKQRWSNIFPSLWSRWADMLKHIFQWCTIWIVLSESVPQNTRWETTTLICSFLSHLQQCWHEGSLWTPPPFCIEASPHATQLPGVFHPCGCLSLKWQTLKALSSVNSHWRPVEMMVEQLPLAKITALSILKSL